MNHQTCGKQTGRSRAAFTLLQSMMIVSLLIVIGSYVLLEFYSPQDAANETAVNIEIKSILGSALETYNAENDMYPTTKQGLAALVEKPVLEPAPTRWRQQLDDVPLDRWQRPYVYRCPGVHNPEKYDLFSMGRDGKPDTADDIGNWQRSEASR